MFEIHAKPIVDDKFWFIEQNGTKVATLHKQENNRFILTNQGGDRWFNQKEDLTNYFGENFFLRNDKIKVIQPEVTECYDFSTRTLPHNAMYDVQRGLPLYTKSAQSKSYHCAGWYLVKFKNWVVAYCPKLITVERYDYRGPFKSKASASQVKCNLK
jgi:hypothetical protein